MTGRARFLSGFAILVAGMLLTGMIVAISFDPLFITGGTAPATIFGADIGKPMMLGGAVILLGAAAWVRRRAVRVALLLFWLVLLASATHRLVEFADGRVEDIWLTLPVQRLAAGSSAGEGEPRCDIGTWLVRCRDGAGHGLSSPTPIPFVPLHPGRWTTA